MGIQGLSTKKSKTQRKPIKYPRSYPQPKFQRCLTTKAAVDRENTVVLLNYGGDGGWNSKLESCWELEREKVERGKSGHTYCRRVERRRRVTIVVGRSSDGGAAAIDSEAVPIWGLVTWVRGFRERVGFGVRSCCCNLKSRKEVLVYFSFFFHL